MITTNQLRDALNETTKEIIGITADTVEMFKTPIDETYFPLFVRLISMERELSTRSELK